MELVDDDGGGERHDQNDAYVAPHGKRGTSSSRRFPRREREKSTGHRK